MSDLLTIREAGAILRCRDPRTAKSRLAKLGVPVLNLDGYLLVDASALDRAIRVHARPLREATDGYVRTGVELSRDDEVWDSPHEVAPRRVSARGRGSRTRQRQAARGAYPAPSATSSSTNRPTEEDPA